MNLGLSDKTAMIAAASEGLGFAVARQLAEEGAHVSICGRREKSVNEAVERINADHPGKAVGTAADVCNPGDILKWRDETLDRFGSVEFLVTNSGGPPAANFLDITDDHWEDAFHLLLLSTIRMIRSVLPKMRDQRRGAILTITSSTVKEPIDALVMSNVMRSGIVSLVKTLSTQMAPVGIRINNLIPGRIKTRRLEALDEIWAFRTGVTTDKWQKDMYQKIPAGRYGKPE